MPRRLLRDRQIVADEWRYESEAEGAALAPLIVTVDAWRAERDRWIARGSRLGLLIAPAHKVETIAQDLHCFALVAAQFPGPADGRGYTQGRLLRERFDFEGELRAAGYVRRDQLFFLARCGFNSFELPDADIEDAHSALLTFSAAYQPANDTGLEFKLRRNIPASSA
jgi:uncharacterized protein (DUF934 family)